MSSTVIDYREIMDTPPAWIGYDRSAFIRGELAIKICPRCEGVRKAEAIAGRLECRIITTLCPRHIAERIAQLTGDTL